jgi:hypothetical protein
MKAQRRKRGTDSYTLSLTSALDGGCVANPARYTPGKKDPVHIVQETGLIKGPVWTGAANFSPTGTRSPDRPSRSESLNELNYPAPHKQLIRFPNSFGFAMESVTRRFLF